MKKLSSLSVFFPSYNDEKNISSVVTKIYQVLPSVAQKYEVIVVNDGSQDNTAQVLQTLKKKYDTFVIKTHIKNKGYGGALISGIQACHYEWVFYTDGDGQYDPQEITHLVKQITPQVDVVNGYKLSRADGKTRWILGLLNNFFLHLFFQIPIRDIDCDFRLMRKSLLKKIYLTSTSGTICIELIMKLKKHHAKFAEVGVHHYNRRHGKSEFLSARNVLKTLHDNAAFFITYNFSKRLS